MDASKFTTRSQQAISAAIDAAAAAGHAQVEAIAPARRPAEAARGHHPPAAAGRRRAALRVESAVRAELAKLPAASGTSVGAPSYSRAALQVLAKANDLAAEMKDDYVSTEHLLVATATVDSPGRRSC